MESRTARGWQIFAATMLLLAGVSHVVQGLVSWFQPEYFAVAEGQVLLFNFAIWGIIMAAGGVLVFLVGLAVLSGQMWARTVGVVFAAISALAQITFLAAFPIWSFVLIALDLLVIYALTAGWPSPMGIDTAESAGSAERAYSSGRRDAQGAPAPRAEDAGRTEGEGSRGRTGRHEQSAG